MIKKFIALADQSYEIFYSKIWFTMNKFKHIENYETYPVNLGLLLYQADP